MSSSASAGGNRPPGGGAPSGSGSTAPGQGAPKPAESDELMRLLKTAGIFLAGILLAFHYYTLGMTNLDYVNVSVLGEAYRATLGGALFGAIIYGVAVSSAVFYWRQWSLLEEMDSLRDTIKGLQKERDTAAKALASLRDRTSQLTIPANVGVLLDKNVDISSVSAARPVVIA